MSSFDRIDHAALLARLPVFTTTIRRWLKAGVVELGALDPTTMGTPQGGIVSPLLANIALDGMERLFGAERADGRHITPCLRRGSNRGINLIRYADDCVPRRHEGVPCCTRDEGWPLAVGLQEQAANHLELRLLRAGVVSVEEKAGMTRQVRIEETSASEPLMTCRKRRDGVETGEKSLPRDKPGGHLLTVQATSGMKAA